MANIFNLPDFMLLNLDSSSLSKFKKITFLIKGLFISIIRKRTNGKIFCFIMNFFIQMMEKFILNLESILSKV